MALYYFHLRNGDDYEEDTTGVELPDVDSARTEAIVAAREILSEQIALGIPIGNQVFEVCEEDQFMVFKLAFKDILHS
ncbi:DUF6894 family protein [Pararhizobium qamdonense]|uniref:DUF6894 family protein n=1 Tax=Pararhizobium qamdonense TaxID=3031126 RepID=UPI0023E1C1E5|nr:hypothetical protein [Pararhizobium qamdonense]